LVAVATIWLGFGAMRSVKHLKYAAENPEEEEDDDGPEEQDHGVGTK
jgi:hypothetical protein